MHTFVIGLGHAGAGLHLPALRRAAVGRTGRTGPFEQGPVLGWDPLRRGAAPAGVLVASPAQVASRLEPGRTVVHLCTPPAVRVDLLAELAELGFRMIVVEKPLALDRAELAGIASLVARYGLRLAVVAHWLSSVLTARLRCLVRGGTMGRLRSVSFVQHKARFGRSALSAEQPTAHPTAFDVELPHSVGVALRLAGAAHVTSAECTDLHVDGTVVPRMGSARLVLAHPAGVRTDVLSDLTSPVRERRVTLAFERGTVVGHYPASRDDDHAQLQVTAGGSRVREVFRDDALTAFLLTTYQRFAARRPDPGGFELQSEVVRLLCAAKQLCAATELVGHAG